MGDDVEARWCGRLDLHLIDAAGAPGPVLALVLQRDVATVWQGDRNLAMIDRDRLRSWLADDREPLERHDLVLAVVESWIGMTISGGPPWWLAPADALRLRTIL